MSMAIYQEALEAFVNPLHEFVVNPIAGGLINQSFKVTSKTTGGSFLLQKINTYVFPEPEKVQQNYEMIWKYIQAEEINFFIPKPEYFIGDILYYCDSKENYWRVFEFVEGAVTLLLPEKTSEAKTAVVTFGNFTANLTNFDSERLNIVIPGFHDLSLRFKQFSKSLHTHNYERLQKAALLIKEVKVRERYVYFFDVITESEEFPQRVMHHDAKISNILFDEETGRVICPVDFDTVMPGYYFSDLGDMIRSMTPTLDERSKAFDEIFIRKDFYEAILNGYLSVMKEVLTGSEKKYIHYAGLIMTYLQALRFLTDYLNEDVYYKITYPEQNFDRAKNQLTLLQRLEEFLLENYQFKT